MITGHRPSRPVSGASRLPRLFAPPALSDRLLTSPATRPPHPEFSGKSGKHLSPVDSCAYTSSETRAVARERS